MAAAAPISGWQPANSAAKVARLATTKPMADAADFGIVAVDNGLIPIIPSCAFESFCYPSSDICPLTSVL